MLRGQRVILDAELAALYGVETKRFNEAVKRNAEKFPQDLKFRQSQPRRQALSAKGVYSAWRIDGCQLEPNHPRTAQTSV
ncbi:MAG: ORF6N domain-containing protein [Burkholderiaceae bacterium]